MALPASSMDWKKISRKAARTPRKLLKLRGAAACRFEVEDLASLVRRSPCVQKGNPIDESTQPSPGIRCNGKSELEAVIREQSRRQKGSIMTSPALFGISVAFGLAVWGAV